MNAATQTQVTDWVASPHPHVPGQWMLSRVDERGHTDYVGIRPELMASAVRAFATKEEAQTHARELHPQLAASDGWTPAAGAMSDEQYVAARGCRCPSCGSSEGIRGGSINVDGCAASQPMDCHVCGTNWTDLYKLIGYTDLESTAQIAV